MRAGAVAIDWVPMHGGLLSRTPPLAAERSARPDQNARDVRGLVQIKTALYAGKDVIEPAAGQVWEVVSF